MRMKLVNTGLTEPKQLSATATYGATQPEKQGAAQRCESFGN